MEFEVVPAEHDRVDAARYWSSVAPYVATVPWSVEIAKAVASFNPSSVLEFGASAGRNLVAVRELCPEASLIGIDINEAALQVGTEMHDLDLRWGDEFSIADYRVDVIFTVSVLDHIPEPGPVIQRMLGSANVAVVLWEPWLGVEGRVARNTVEGSGEMIDSTPFSYSWDYERLVAGLAVDVNVKDAPIPTNLGRWCRMHTLTKRPGRAGDPPD